MPPAGTRATLASVAASAGISVATVSKVLNGRGDVSPTTRARVQEVIRQQGYVGRRPAATERAAVELFFQGVLTHYSLEVVQGVLDAGAAAGVDIVVSSHPGAAGAAGPPRAASWVRELIATGRRAAVGVTSELAAADLVALSQARLPLVVIDPINITQPDVTSVGSTNYAGGLAATEHLLALGHRRIAYLGGTATASCNQARMHGFRGAMEAAGAPVPDGYVLALDFQYDSGLIGGAALLDLPQPPTAVFTGNDEVALGLIEAARARGLRVPEDLSIVGFDDTQAARLSSPQLTTVRQPLREMGAVALRTALRLASGEKVDSHHVELATTLVVRGSAVPPP
ncbi:LacI family DNA-binding transcriptional regulator [Pseudonocardia sp. GCM10023141]|uniref:LacI family DNA-binding transcriptional regulator n=1 Tax=Pseudonocardia sp. GCM10023141 TaxID=3252653 RepID=UPI00361FB874